MSGGIGRRTKERRALLLDTLWTIWSVLAVLGFLALGFGLVVKPFDWGTAVAWGICALTFVINLVVGIVFGRGAYSADNMRSSLQR